MISAKGAGEPAPSTLDVKSKYDRNDVQVANQAFSANG